MRLKVVASLSLITFFAAFCSASYAQTFSLLHTFTCGWDGCGPDSGVTLKDGTLYVTTQNGGNPQYWDGTVDQITHVGSNWLTTPILSFSTGGNNPEARVLFGPDGLLYGTTSDAGINNAGVFFSLAPPVSICSSAMCFWTENVLYSFKGAPEGDGSGGNGFGDLVWDQQGNVYGATPLGGTPNRGTVYKLTKSGDSWAETLLHVFSGPDGYLPLGGVVLDNSGNVFGTTMYGGSKNVGTVFELKYVVGVGWTETILHSFQNGSDGAQPFGGLTWDASGNLYGSTTAGTIFELSPSGESWTYKIIYTIPGPTFSCGPEANLTIDAAGDIYGTTYCAGAYAYGNVFKLTNTGNGWQYLSLHDFTRGDDGAYPRSNVTIDTDGTLYGTTLWGTVWMIKP